MARIQKIESDSSFQLSQVLEGTFLTYKTYQNGRVVHKAKLANGNVVEISGRTFRYKKAYSNISAADQDFIICCSDLKVTLPAIFPDAMIGISTGTNDVTVVVAANGNDKIQISSDSLVSGIVLAQKMSTTLLVAQQGHWAMAAGCIQPVNLSEIQRLLEDYYTKEQIDEKLQNIASNSTIQDIYDKFQDYYTKGQISDALEDYYTKEQVDTLLSNSLSLQNYYTKDQIDRMLQQLSNSFSISLSNYYTKLEVDGFVQSLSNSIQNLKGSLADSYYTSYQVNLISNTLAGFIAGKIDKPASSVSNGYVLMKTSSGTSWGSVAGGTPFVSSNYYTSAEVQGRLSSYYTSLQINAISSGLNDDVNSRMYNPSNTGSVGNVLIKTAAGTSWGGSVYTGDTFNSVSYYTSSQVNDMLGDLSDSLHTKLTAPAGGSQGDVLIKTANGTSWGSVAGGTQTWTSLTVPSYGALVVDPSSGALQKFTMTRNLIISTPTLTAASNELTLQVAHHVTSNYVLSKGALQITVGQNLLFTWYYDGAVTRELPTIYLGK